MRKKSFDMHLLECTSIYIYLSLSGPVSLSHGIFQQAKPQWINSLHDCMRLFELIGRHMLSTYIYQIEPLGQSQPNLAQNILGWRGFQNVQMKGHILFQGGDNYEIANFRIFFLRFQPNLAQSIPGWRVLKFSQINYHF